MDRLQSEWAGHGKQASNGEVGTMSRTEEMVTTRESTTGQEGGPSEPASGFLPTEHVVVRKRDNDERNWDVVAPLSYTGETQTFRVPPEMETDFASVPRFFVWFLPRYGRYTKAAIIHDHLWRHEVPSRITRREADAIFRRAMRELDVAFLRRWLMWSAVRWGSLSKKDGRKGWWKDAWRVVPLTLLALPIVAPPGLLILLALLVFWAIELVVWVPLKLAHMVRPRKKVNRPSLLMKL